MNPIKEKKLTNIRAAGKDDAMLLIPPRRMSLEQAIAYIEDDELVEVTPGAVRLRKRYLDPHAAQAARAAGGSRRGVTMDRHRCRVGLACLRQVPPRGRTLGPQSRSSPTFGAIADWP